MDARSGLLDSVAIVDFVRALSQVAQEELRPVAAPRVYSLTKIVEISHFNMSRIRCPSMQPPLTAQLAALLEKAHHAIEASVHACSGSIAQCRDAQSTRFVLPS